jgi:hypothetical protein
METTAIAFMTVGGVLLAGLALDAAGPKAGVPGVTLLLVLGFAVGPVALDVLPEGTDQFFPVVASLALAMIGFLPGGEFTREALHEHGGVVARVAVLQAAATLAAVQELEAKGPLTRTLVAVVAVDDVAAVAIFGIMASIAAAISDNGGGTELAVFAAREIFGGVGVGLVLGVPMAYATGRMRAGEPTQEEAIGGVLICAGIALWLDVSYLLATVTLGAVVANFARHSERPFREIEGVEWPFLTLFFVLAGASLEIDVLASIAEEMIAVVVTGTIVFELVGPLATRFALMRAGEAS